MSERVRVGISGEPLTWDICPGETEEDLVLVARRLYPYISVGDILYGRVQCVAANAETLVFRRLPSGEASAQILDNAR